MKLDDFKGFVKEQKSEFSESGIKELQNEEIAIIGIHTRLPLAKDTDDFWRNITNGISCVTRLPEQRKKDTDNYVKASTKYGDNIEYSKGSYLDNIDEFDNAFFNIPPKEASLMNPRHRIFLEAAWNVFEDAGYAPGKLSGRNIGVYVGHIADMESYIYKEMIGELAPSLLSTSLAGNLSSIIPSRISYLLNLKGPSLNVDTACSSSLTALEVACNALRRGECEMAMVGATRINLLPENADHLKLGIESSDEETRAFDEHADGSGMGEGAATIILKPLHMAKKDGDTIYCVIKGGASNQDGTSMGITAPNPSAQTDVITKAWKDAGIDPTTISYIETHGTGTKLGDPIEIEGITKAFEKYTDKRQFCAISSVKSNIGHLYDSAGLVGLIKAVMALKHKVIPPSLHFKTPNKQINLTDSPIYINTKAKKWIKEDNKPRRCGVSSFGLSGTNCHIILEEYIDNKDLMESNDDVDGESFLFTLSAKSTRSMQLLLEEFINYFKGDMTQRLKDICYTLALGRDHHHIRLALIVKNKKDIINKLQVVNKVDLNQFCAPWYFYGEKTVQNEKKSMDGNPKKLVESFQSVSSKEYISLLSEIADMYTGGIEIRWEEVYRDFNANKTNLPVYQFDRKRNWLSIPDLAPTSKLNEQLYNMTWIEEINKGQPRSLDGEVILMMGERKDLVNELTKEGARCIEVNYGEQFTINSPQSYTVSDNKEDYAKLIGEIKEQKVSKILHLASAYPTTEIANVKELMDRQNIGVYSLFNLIQSLLEGLSSNRLEVYLVANCVNKVSGNEKKLNPDHSTLFGLGKVIGIENPHISCKAVDIDEETTNQEILTELKTERKTYQIAYREGKRYAEKMTQIDIEEIKDKPVKLKDDGVYVITGGTGNLGLLTAKHLASKEKINLALINRTPMPDVSKWDSIVNDGDSKLQSKVRMLKDLVDMGAVVECLSVDVASLEEMNSSMERLRQRYGRINGVIHAAGIAGNGFLMGKERKVFDAVLRPKVLGTWVLDKVTEKDNLDFFVMYSSGVALSGEMGQSDYTAANSYLDAFAEYRKSLGKPALSINWVVWEGIRMSEGKSENIDNIFKAIPASQALQALDRVISKDITRILIGELNSVNRNEIELLGQDILFHLPEKLNALLNRNKINDEASYQHLAKSEIRLLGDENDEYTEVHKALAGIYKEVLGYEEINIHDTFFEMGGDSVQLHRMHRLIEQQYPGETTIADLFAYSSIYKLAEFIIGHRESLNKSKDKEATEIGGTQNTTMSNDDIAIIGMSALFPGSSTLTEYWDNIRNGIDCIGKIPDGRKAYLNKYLDLLGKNGSDRPGFMNSGYLEGVDEFDYEFFKISPKEAKLTDPNQRLFMQTAIHAMENAGYGGEKLRKSRTGIYIGYANVIRDSYQKLLTDINPEIMSQSVVGNVSAMIPTRISYMLDLKGPSMVLDTACSSSLVATHLACKAIKNGECDTAIVGGIKLFLSPFDYDYYKIGIESKDGKTRAFDDYSDGSGIGEGSAAIIIKSLKKAKEDGDHIHAVIKGSAINQDGASMGITAPNPNSQTNVIKQAWKDAGINPESIAFFEAHGTGTELGDPIEVSGLKNAIEAYSDKKQFCALGSVKTNIGHLNEGAGMASIIKAVMSLKNREIPPTLYFQKPNKKTDFHDSPLYINSHLRKWDGEEPMRCAISSFGLSGTNGHMVIEEYRDTEGEKHEIESTNAPQILTISASSEEQLRDLVKSYYKAMEIGFEGNLKDICGTTTTGRGHYKHRLAFVVFSIEDLKNKLTNIVNLKEYQNISIEGIYYGVHRVVSDKRSIKNESDITEEMKMKINNRLREFLQSSGLHSEKERVYLAKMYVKGADVSWGLLYIQGEFNKVQLPLYPFEKTKCWVDIPEHKTLEKTKVGGTPNSKSFIIKWRKEKLPNRQENIDPVLIINDSIGYSNKVSELLKRSGRTVYTLDILSILGNKENRKGNIQAQLNAFLKDLEKAPPSQIIHCSSLQKKDVSSFNDLILSQKNGAESLFLFMKAWGECGFTNDTELFVVSQYANKVTGKELNLRPENAPLFGIGQSLPKEFENIKYRGIDIDDGLTPEDLLLEINANTESRLVAYRHGERYREVFNEYNVDELPNETGPIVRENGVYIITGGTGGIGLETAKWLASKGKIKLVLVSRSILPKQSQWHQILKQGEKQNLCEKIIGIQDIEAKGSQVILYNADVSNLQALENMFKEIRGVYGEIKGIVHAAGIVRTETIADKSIETFKEVISAKVYGTWLLNQLSSEDVLDFFLMYSSVATMFETGYQSDYLAANAYLDAFSNMPSQDGRKKLTINRTTWRDKGMAANSKFRMDTIFKAIKSEQAMEVMSQIWHNSQTRVLIGELNLDSKMALWLNNYPIELSATIKEKLDRLKESEQLKTKVPDQNIVKQKDNEKQSYNLIEQKVLNICRKVLGFSEIDIYESFFEMGADSLIIRQIHQHLNQEFEDVEITDLFEFPTVYKISDCIKQKVEGNTKQENENSNIRESKGIDSIEEDEELNLIFNELESGTMDIDSVLSKLSNRKG